jgi:tetratricopeptide (TPR) repeat protein
MPVKKKNSCSVADQIHSLQDLVNHGRYLEARELAFQLRNISEVDHERVDQLLALSLSKSGSPEDALAQLDLTYRRNPNDPETAGILGGIYKELFKKHQDSKYAILSRDTYAKNYSSTQNYYTGINAATMSVIAGRAIQGREIANSVIELIGKGSLGFWELATLGEAYLLVKNRERSIEYYIEARQLAGNDWGKVISVHNQLWLLNHYLPVPKDVLKIFNPPQVVAFAGHMIDAPDRKTPRFPALIENKVKDSIKGAIRTINASIGYSSLASGADILFAEAMAEEGGEVHVLMPFSKGDFINTSLRFAGEQWVKRFEELLTKFPINFITKENYGGNDDLFSLLGKVIFGSAVLRSQTYHQEPYLLTVLSEFDLRQKEGGTRATIQMWPFPQKHVNINPDAMFNPSEVQPVPSNFIRPQLPRITERPVAFIACIELQELHTIEQERIEKMVRAYADENQLSFKVLTIVDGVLTMALDTEIALMDIVKSVWNSTAPFKPEKPLRIGLHVAPVTLYTHEEDEDIRFLRAISQFAPKGSICLSTSFASVIALHPKKFQLDYVGSIQVSEEAEGTGLYKLTFK